jgi:DNA-binding transcriptional ArsR family regulator
VKTKVPINPDGVLDTGALEELSHAKKKRLLTALNRELGSLNMYVWNEVAASYDREWEVILHARHQWPEVRRLEGGLRAPREAQRHLESMLYEEHGRQAAEGSRRNQTEKGNLTRARILQIARENPKAGAAQIAKRAKVSRSTVTRNLAKVRTAR